MAYKELKVSEWWTEIERCLEYRKKYGLEERWSMIEALYANVHQTQMNAGPNLIMANADTLVSGLTTPYPYISAEPRRADQVENTSIVETIDNMLIRELGIPQEMSEATLSAYLWSVGILKIGYDSEYGYDSAYDLGPKSQPLGMTMTQFDSKGWRIEFGNTTPGMPWVASVLPHDFLVPWGTKNIKTAEFAIHRVVRHIDDVKADPKYDNTRELQPVMSMEDFVKSYQSVMKPYRLGSVLRDSTGERSKKAEFVELWEIHDRRTGKIIVIATGHDKFLRNEPDLLQLNGLPFVGFGFVPSTRNFWRTSDADYLLQAQLELTDITIQSAKIRRSQVVKGVVNQSMFDEEELEKLQSSRVAMFVKSNGNPQEAVAYTQPPPNPNLYQEAESVRRNAREMIGFSRNQAGEYEPGGRRTAYEVAQVAQGSDQRQTRRQGVIADAYIELFSKLNAICGRYWTTPRLVQVMDQNSITSWKAITGEALAGEYGYAIEFSNEGPKNRQVDRQTALQLLPFLQQDPLVDPAAVRRWLVRSVNDPSFSSVYPPQVLTGAVNAPLQSQVSGVQQTGGGSADGADQAAYGEVSGVRRTY